MKKDPTKLWDVYDEKGTLLWTRIPNRLLQFLAMGEFKFAEIRILLFIFRMTFGFKREQSNYLALEDFECVTAMKKPHVSRAINSLLSRYIIFRYDKNGNKYKYATNLMPHGFKMKHFRIGKVDDKIDDGVYQSGNVVYELSKFTDVKDDLILYSAKGYENSNNLYIKEDRKLDINNDKAIHASSPVFGSSTSTALKSKTFQSSTANTAPSNIPAPSRPQRNLSLEQEKALYASFKMELQKNYNVEVLLKPQLCVKMAIF